MFLIFTIFLEKVFGQSDIVGLNQLKTSDKRLDYGKLDIEPKFNSTCDVESLHAALLCEER